MLLSFFRKPAPRKVVPAKPLKELQDAFGPPRTPEEIGANLSELESRLNARMACPAGRNQVFIRSLVTRTGTTPPRIALKCSLRRDIGLKPDVFYEHIRDVCCSNPNQCPAFQKFQDRFVQT